MKVSINYRFILRMAVFVILLTILLFTLGTIITKKLWWPDLLEDFVYVSCCTLFCSLLLDSLYKQISLLSRFLFFLVFTLLSSLGVVIGLIISTLILEGGLYFSVNFFLAIIIGVLFSGGVTVYEVQKSRLEEKITRLKAAELENEQLRRLESEARFNSLQAKLNPHFLFNTLNSLAALVYDNPVIAEKSIVRLSELYRSVLSISNQTFITITEELALIKDYLELEKLRFQDQLTYTLQVSHTLENRRIPGLLIEPLIGNVIKHVTEQTEKAVHVLVTIKEQDGHLVISVSDNGPGFDEAHTSSGYGLYSIQERLKLLFGEDYKFNLKSKPGKGLKVTIRIPSHGIQEK